MTFCENPIEDLEHLVAYLSMTDEDEAIEAVYTFDYWIANYTNTVDDLLEDENLPKAVRRELETFDPEEGRLSELSNETIVAVASALDVNKILDFVMENEPGEYPLWAAAELRGPGVQEGWLIHRSDDAEAIAARGFRQGVDDVRMLALTCYLGNAMKKHPGYNFAFTIADYGRYQQEKYGRRAVIFRAPFVRIFHYFDEEPQAIFWGPDATNIYQLFEDYGFYTVDLEDEDGEIIEVETKSLEELVKIIEEHEASQSKN